MRFRLADLDIALGIALAFTILIIVRRFILSQGAAP